MTETASAEKMAAVRRLVDGFDAIPSSWALLVAEHIDREECYALPMWGTLFKVDSMDRHNIEKLLSDPVPTDLQELIEFAEDRDIDLEGIDNAMRLVALAASDPDEIEEDEIEDLRTEVYEAWTEGDDEDALLWQGGWYSVGDTGLFAREFDGHLLLGVNGAGYDFYESHWLRLYDELGYTWHVR